MAAIKDKLSDDIKVAMKAREATKLQNLRGLMAAFKQIEIDTRTELDESQELAVIQKEIKKRKDALEFARQANREDAIANNESEIALLQGYLGEQLSEAQLKDMIVKLKAEGADNLGKIMGGLNATHKGKFDGKLASELAKSVLGKP